MSPKTVDIDATVVARMRDDYGLTEPEARLAAGRIAQGGTEEAVVRRILADRVGPAAGLPTPEPPNTAPVNIREYAAEQAALAQREAEAELRRAEEVLDKADELTRLPSADEVGTPITDSTSAAPSGADTTSGEPTGDGTGAEPPPPPLPPSGFDPAENTVEEVQRHVVNHPDEAQVIAEAEAAGRNRSTLMSFFADIGVKVEAGGEPPGEVT